MGYYSRRGYDKPFYYSPRRVVSALNHCGVDEFIVSSTCAQVAEIGIDGLMREALEMKRISGSRAHVFFWLSARHYDEDEAMSWFGSGLFEGIKLHEGETPWMRQRRGDLRKVLSFAANNGLPVIFHSSPNEGSRPFDLATMAKEFPSVCFNFAHCRPIDDMAKVVAAYPNVWTDTAYMAFDGFPTLRNYDWCGRLMFGTDFPVWQAYESVRLKRRYMEYARAIQMIGFEPSSEEAFRCFLAGAQIHKSASSRTRWAH